MRSALITGGAGFIGSHVVDALLSEGWSVTVVDNFDPFYAESIKLQNLAPHHGHPNFRLLRADIRNTPVLRASVPKPPDVIVHLAAKAGVRPSILDAGGYFDVNVYGTQNMLELAREWGVKQFVFGSSSSVYGVNPRVPWSESDSVLLPISPYAATKVAGELLGHVYSHLHGFRFLALRLFTVFGPRQRPDLAIHKFARLLQAGQAIPLYGSDTRRDYTFIGDIVAGIRAAMDYRGSQYEVINLGSEHPISLEELLRVLAETLHIEPKIARMHAQPGDVPQTFADSRKAKALLGFKPKTDFRSGIAEFCRWLKRSQPPPAGPESPA
jgi:UDP-glucuronate 4-epimerase